MKPTNNTLKFERENEENVRLANFSYSVKSVHGIEPDYFIRIFENISQKYRFSLTQEFLKAISVQEAESNGKKIKVTMFNIIDIADFFLNCSVLLDNDIDIKNLLKEFQASGDYRGFEHSVSLSRLAALFTLEGYKSIKFGGKTDFELEGLSAELKVIHLLDPDKRFDAKAEGANEFSSIVGKDVCYDVGQSIQNRLYEAIMESAEIVFMDLSRKSLLGVFSDKIFTIENIVPEPKKHRVILFCWMDKAFLKGALKDKMKAYSFYGSYIDFDPELWRALGLTRKTKHKRVGDARLRFLP
jgi:hypothetical protein